MLITFYNTGKGLYLGNFVEILLYKWIKKTERFYPSAPLEPDDLEHRLEKNLNDLNSFNNHINDIKKVITYFNDKNNKSKKRYEN